MQSTSLAPLLSATLSRDSCWIIAGVGLFGAFDHFHQAPTLRLAHRARLHDAHGVALMGLAVLIMRHELAGGLHELPVFGVLHAALHHHRDALVHLLAGDDADPLLPEIAFHGGSYLLLLASSRLRSSVRMRATSLRRVRSSTGLSMGLTVWLKRSLF